jgi:hypothetical protein
MALGGAMKERKCGKPVKKKRGRDSQDEEDLSLY